VYWAYRSAVLLRNSIINRLERIRHVDVDYAFVNFSDYYASLAYFSDLSAAYLELLLSAETALMVELGKAEL